LKSDRRGDDTIFQAVVATEKRRATRARRV
jgi:hypothetical protein